MSLDVLGDVNWLAVLAGAAAYWFLGAGWYARPVFGDRWMAAIGWEPPPDERPGAAYLVLTALMALLASAGVGMLAVAADADGLGDGIVLGLVVGVLVVGGVLLGTASTDPTRPRPWTWFAITAGYHAVGILLAAAIVSLWR